MSGASIPILMPTLRQSNRPWAPANTGFASNLPQDECASAMLPAASAAKLHIHSRFPFEAGCSSEEIFWADSAAAQTHSNSADLVMQPMVRSHQRPPQYISWCFCSIRTGGSVGKAHGNSQAADERR